MVDFVGTAPDNLALQSLLGTAITPQGAGFTPDPTGISDSWAALQGALTYACDNKLHFHIPAGDYKITAPLTTGSATWVGISGAGYGHTTLRPSANNFDGLVIGPGSGAPAGPTGWLRDIGIGGPSANPSTGKAAVKLSNMPQFLLENIGVDNYDICYDFINNCYGGIGICLRGGFGGTCNVGINFRGFAESGSDFTFINPWLTGSVAAVHMSPGSTGLHIIGGQLCGYRGSANGLTSNDGMGCIIVGKDYLTSATGDFGIWDLRGVDLEGITGVWLLRSYGQSIGRIELCNCLANSGEYALGVWKGTGFVWGKMRWLDNGFSGDWSTSTAFWSLAGWGTEAFIEESGTYFNSPCVVNSLDMALNSVSSMMEQSLYGGLGISTFRANWADEQPVISLGGSWLRVSGGKLQINNGGQAAIAWTVVGTQS